MNIFGLPIDTRNEEDLVATLNTNLLNDGWNIHRIDLAAAIPDTKPTDDYRIGVSIHSRLVDD